MNFAVWWIDFDTLVMNMDTRIEDIIEGALANVTNPGKIDFMFTPDWYVPRLDPLLPS